jgi:maltokinase
MTVLLGLIAAGGRVGTVRFTPERPESLTFAERAGLPVRRVSAEQSNTSMVYGDRFILKLFRRLVLGVNPELEVHRGLRDVDDPHTVALLGAIELDLADGLDLDGGLELGAGPVTLGVLHAFLPDAVDGWALVTSAVFTGEGPGVELGPLMRELGVAVATVHRHLGDAFGRAELTGDRLAALLGQVRERLQAAARAAPALREHVEDLRVLVDRAGLPAGEHVQRIHGDLHLGQALHTDAGWVLIDFEGEPAASVADRVSWRSPLQDVAGMLRSLDYAAGYLQLSGDVPEGPTRDRIEAARAAFWQGYADASGLSGLDRAALLRAYEADKAAYEVAYETRYRPTWLPIPLSAIRRLTDNLMK